MSLLFVSILSETKGQDINFSQFYDLPLLRNPALAGIFTGDVRVTSAYRNQWQQVTVPFRTMGLGIEIKRATRPDANDYFTIGLQATHDVAGDSKLSRTQLFPVLNYHKSLGGDKATFLSAAFMAGPVMQQFDPTKLTFDDQFQHGSFSASNPTRQAISNNRLTYWDPAAGINFSSTAGENTNYYIGLGVFHFTRPKVSFQPENDFRLNPKYVMNIGIAAPTSHENTLIVYGDLFMQGGSRQAQGGLLFSHDLVQRDDDQKTAISAGLFYRMNDALIPVVKLDYFSTSIGITYDLNTSKLKTASQYRGGFELTLSYKAFKKYNSAADMVRCPTFF